MEVLEADAQENKVPREVAQIEVQRYAREIVPAFNAYIYFRLGYWLARRIAQGNSSRPDCIERDCI